MKFKIYDLQTELPQFTVIPPPFNDYLTMSIRHTLIKMNRIMYRFFEFRTAQRFEVGWMTYVFDLSNQMREELEL